MSRIGRVLTALLGLGLLIGCGGAAEESRVGEVLKELRGGEGQFERALMMWNRGSIAAAGVAEAAEASPQFQQWLAEGGIESFSEYEVSGSRSEEGSNPPAVIVSGTIDGRAFEVRVIRNRPLEWVVKPGG